MSLSSGLHLVQERGEPGAAIDLGVKIQTQGDAEESIEIRLGHQSRTIDLSLSECSSNNLHPTIKYLLYS
jgi:hypothetical protein